MTTQLDREVTRTHHDGVTRKRGPRGSEYWWAMCALYSFVFFVLIMIAVFTGWYYPIWGLPAFAAIFCAIEALVQRKPVERQPSQGYIRQQVEAARAERAEAEAWLAEEKRLRRERRR